MNANILIRRKLNYWAIFEVCVRFAQHLVLSQKERQCRHVVKSVKECLKSSIPSYLSTPADSDFITRGTSVLDKNSCTMTSFTFSVDEDTEQPYCALSISRYMSYQFSEDRDYTVETSSGFDLPMISFYVTYKNKSRFRIMLGQSGLTPLRRTFCVCVVAL